MTKCIMCRNSKFVSSYRLNEMILKVCNKVNLVSGNFLYRELDSRYIMVSSILQGS